MDSCQWVVSGGWDGGGLDLDTVGGSLLHVTGPSDVHVLTGRHTGRIQLRARGLPGPPADGGTGWDEEDGEDGARGWDVVERVTLWSPEGSIVVHGLLGASLPEEPVLAVAGPGLYRIEVRARNRISEGTEPDPATGPEQHQLLVWPVREDRGHEVRQPDADRAGSWAPRPAAAAERAVLGLLIGVCTDPLGLYARNAPIVAPPVVPGLPRAAVRREVRVAASPERALHAVRAVLGLADGGGAALPAGPLRVLLDPLDGAAGPALSWSWAWDGDRPGPDGPEGWAADLRIPDRTPSRVTIGAEAGAPGTAVLAVRHDGVTAQHAVLLGLVWDHVLDRARALAQGEDGDVAGPRPWEPLLDRIADRGRRTRARAAGGFSMSPELAAIGGRPLPERLRDLEACVRPLAWLDRPLLDALADAPPARQRDVAAWAARAACDAAGLAATGALADALAALDRGDGLPARFADRDKVWDELLADPDVPVTLVAGTGGALHCRQQAMALQALLSVDDEDPLAAAVNSLYQAGQACGRDQRRLFEQARAAFPELRPAPAGPPSPPGPVPAAGPSVEGLISVLQPQDPPAPG